MMKTAISFLFLLGMCSSFHASADSMSNVVTLKSIHNVSTTADKLESILSSKGMTVFARIDHAVGAAKVDMQLNPTQLVIFGNPKVGTPLMQCSQNIAIDLPQKALIWEDQAGDVWLSYNAPQYLRDRHDVEGCDEVFERVAKALSNFASAATK